MKPEISEKIPQILLRALASTYTLYFTSQVAHWNVEGPNFIQLHSLFKDSYEDAADTVDTIAERVRQYEVMIPSSLTELLSLSTFTQTNDTFIKELLDMHTKLKDQWDNIAVVAEAAEDSATVDLAGKRAGVHSKFAWMLRSLQKASNA